MRIELHKGQGKAWRSQKRFVGMIAGTGGGKTYFGPIWLMREISKNPDGVFLIVSPTFRMFKRIVLPRVLSFFNEVFKGDYKAGELAYYLPSGGVVYFGSGDNPYSLEGVHCRAVWMDEAGMMRREVWDVVNRRVGYYGGRVLITTTPYNLGWLKLEVYDRWKEGDPDYDVVQFSSITNPYYPVEEYERAKKVLPDWKFKMFYEGQFVRAEGLVYSVFNPSEHLVDVVDDRRFKRLVAGVDFGYNNPFAIIYLLVDNDGVMVAFREYYKRFKMMGEVIKEEGEWLRRCEVVVADPSRPDLIKEMREAGIQAVGGDNKVIEGIEEVIKAFRGRRLFIKKGLVNILDEIENYKFKGGEEGFRDEVVKEYDHLLDALRYVVVYLSQGAGVIGGLI